tara:strand:+ start:1280 stop:1540 length:261 start_codon:yes stop_codon:yes gene_type:complete
MSKKSYKKPTKRGLHIVIVLNDNVNTFQHVRKCLQEICGHNYIQAIQCTNIIHGAGRCEVYTDSYDQCVEVYKELTDKGLAVSIVK